MTGPISGHRRRWRAQLILYIALAFVLGLTACSTRASCTEVFDCDSCCWPRGQIGPFLPCLCEDYVEDPCRCFPEKNPPIKAYDAPVPGKSIS